MRNNQTSQEQRDTYRDRIDRGAKMHDLLDHPRANPLLAKAYRLNQRRLSDLKYCYSVLHNAADRIFDQAEAAQHSDEFDMLRLAGLTQRQVSAFHKRLSKLRKAAESAARGILGSKKAAWTETQYDPTDPQAHIPF